MRLRLLVCALLAAVTAALLGAPAQAAAKKPGTVGLVSFTKAVTYESGGKRYARVRLSWPKVKNATRYEVFVARTKTNVSKAKKPKVKVKGTQAVVKNLGRGKEYWFQVRAVNGSKAGNRSARVARITPIVSATLPTSTHPTHSMLSYNICSNACKKPAWSGRQQLVVDRIAAIRPGIVALQEASRWTATVPGYVETDGGKDNRILYRPGSYEPVTQQVDPTSTDECIARNAKGAIIRVKNTNEPVRNDPCVLPVDGVANPPGKKVPWAMLRHRATGQEILVAGVHLLTGNSNANARYRADQTHKIFADLRDQLAWWGRDFNRTPVALIGDFNTNRSRSNHDIVESAMKAHGFWDSYEQAQTLTRQHQNTANPSWQWKTPTIGVTWGDHVDKVWVRPKRSRVRLWENAGAMNAAGTQYLTPLPSDHHPLLIRAQIS